MTDERDALAITTVRMLALDGVERAASGHPGLPLGMAPVAYTIFTRHLRYDPSHPDWPNRDRFVLSAGHGSMLLYSLLHMAGYDLPIEELKRFRKFGSKTPGHPEFGLTPGVETTTGPLGQGLATGVGMALASRLWAARTALDGAPLVDFRVFGIVSDGDLMEGISHEAASLAGHLGLGNIVYVYDDNHISIEGATELALSDRAEERFAAYGWQVLRLPDPEDVEAIDGALQEAVSDPRPSLVIARTHIGYKSPVQDTPKAHGNPMGREAQLRTREAYGWPADADFLVPEAARAPFTARAEEGRRIREAWERDWSRFQAAHPKTAEALRRTSAGEAVPDLGGRLPLFAPEDGPMATRQASGKVLNAIAASVPELVGGSADLAPSTDTWINGAEAVAAGAFGGRNIHFGVREHAMGAVLNGLALSGFRPYGGTFLIFSDYMRPAIRLAALMGLPVTYVFTHDSIGLGEDGPTHQPVEQAMSLRLIPNMVVLRPADAAETAEAWEVALKRTDGPTALLLTRQKLPILDRSELLAPRVHEGAYVLRETDRTPDAVVAATGSEVAPAVEAARTLASEGLAVRVVSVPSLELWRARGREAVTALMPEGVPSLSVEAGVTHGWEGVADRHMGVDRFGASGPAKDLFEAYHLTADAIADTLRSMTRGG